MGIQQFIGRALGRVYAPFTFVGSLLRGDRVFHPDGVIYRAKVKPMAKDGPLGQLAQRLAGTALVRLSGGIWAWPEGKRRRDILGMAVRFQTHDEVLPQALPGDQDLLFATARTVPGILVAPFVTDAGDFLDNTYYTILPFTLEGVGKVYLRIVPKQGSPAGADRRERLALAVTRGAAALRLEVRRNNRGEQWLPIAEIDLRERVAIDDDLLTFDPGTAAMGLVPSGVLQWTRPLTYAASRIGWMLRRRG